MRYLKKFKKPIFIVIMVGLIFALFFVAFNRNAFDTAVYIILMTTTAALLLLILFCALNMAVRKKIFEQRKPFNTFSGIRNINTLYIGEITRGGGTLIKNDLRIYTPNATEGSVYEVLRHTFSILNENGGTVILCVNGKRRLKRKSFSVFDIPFFNDVTINRLKLNGLKKKLLFPLLFDFVGCFRYIFKIGYNARRAECTNEEIVNFCKLRNISLIYLVTY